MTDCGHLQLAAQPVSSCFHQPSSALALALRPCGHYLALALPAHISIGCEHEPQNYAGMVAAWHHVPERRVDLLWFLWVLLCEEGVWGCLQVHAQKGGAA